MLRYSRVPADQADRFPDLLKGAVSVSTATDFETIEAEAGLQPPTLFSPSLLIHGWSTVVAPGVA